MRDPTTASDTFPACADGESLPPPRISVIIPTLNEARFLPKTLAALPTQKDLEIILVDGGSQDATVQIARDHGARVFQTDPGRARQMNAGAAAARGHLLIFLHADTLLPGGFEQQVHELLQDEKTVLGAFHLRVHGSGVALRLVELLVNFRSRCFRMPYGDQALFLRRRTFHEAGGFPVLPIMEDFELVRRLKKCGKVVIAPDVVSTSARRWRAAGILRTTLANQLIILGYLAGISTQRLARWRPRERRRDAGRCEPVQTTDPA